MKRLKGFTLAEVLITLAIIGVVAAISIPSVISNSQQQEFKTGLRKAVSVLNSAITMNMAIDGESPYDNANLFGYLQRHMAVVRSSVHYDWAVRPTNGVNKYNSVFYTTDGMRFELSESVNNTNKLYLYENPSIAVCADSLNTWYHGDQNSDHYNPGELCGGCGSYGLNNNPDGTTKPPCLILVDVNGDKKPTPGNVNCRNSTCARKDNIYKVPLPAEKKVRDIFSILITEDRAMPYGVTAQKAMYQAQK